MIKICLRIKKHSAIGKFRRINKRIIKFRKKFVIFTGKDLCWPLQAFFYRTPRVATSGYSQQQMLFSVEFGIYC